MICAEPHWGCRPSWRLTPSPGDLVVEPFAGAATAGVACLELGGRRYLGIENSPRLAERAVQRLAAVKAAKTPRELEK
jgi:DNA modification methylase